MAEQYNINELLQLLRGYTAAGSLEWRRSTGDQIYASLRRNLRVVITRKEPELTHFLTVRAAGEAARDDYRLSVHHVDSAGVVAPPSIEVRTSVYPIHFDLMMALWFEANEACDAPRSAVRDVMDALFDLDEDKE